MAEEIKSNATIPLGSPSPQKDEGQEDEPTEGKVAQDALDKVDKLSTELDGLQEVFGKHTKEVGELRQVNQGLIEQNQVLEQSLADIKANTASGDERNVADIFQRIEDGEVGLAEGLKVLTEATKEQATKESQAMAEDVMKQELAKRDRASREQKFLDDNEDYLPLLESGAIDGVKAKNPMHDNFSAYYELKAAQNYEKGKTDQAKIDEGSVSTEKVLGKPGTAIRQVNKSNKPLTELEMKNSGHAALQRLREAG